MASGHPTVVCIPSSDDAFRTHVDVALASLAGRDGTMTPEGLRAEIAKAYPDAVVHSRDRLASFGASDTAWYVYRDREPVKRPVSEPWWEDPALPRTTIAGDGRYLDANAAALELFGIDRKRLRRGRAGDFSRHEGPHLGPPLFESLMKTGFLESTAVVSRPDGTEVRIAYRMIRDGAGPERHVTVMRPLDAGASPIPRSAG